MLKQTGFVFADKVEPTKNFWPTLMLALENAKGKILLRIQRIGVADPIILGSWDLSKFFDDWMLRQEHKFDARFPLNVLTMLDIKARSEWFSNTRMSSDLARIKVEFEFTFSIETLIEEIR